MFLSTVRLSEKAKKLVRHPHALHCRLEMAFPQPARVTGDPANITPFDATSFVGPTAFARGTHVRRSEDANYLYRVDAILGGWRITIQSGIQPNLDYAFANIKPLLAAPPKVEAYDLKLVAGDQLVFRLRMSPIGAGDKPANRDASRQRVYLPPADAIELVRFKLTGACVIEQIEETGRSSQVTERANGPAGSCKVPVIFADYEGRLTVTDPVKLRAAMTMGLGRQKCYGGGLLLFTRPL